MKGAIQSGLFNGDSIIDNIRPDCSSGDCTWDPYLSFAVCSSSADVSSHLKMTTLTSGDVRFSVTPNNWLQNPSLKDLLDSTSSAPAVVNISSAVSGIVPQLPGGTNRYIFQDSIAFPNSPSPLTDVFMIYTNQPSGTSSNGSYSAVEFILEWCVQRFNTSVVNGTATTQRLESFSNFSAPTGEDYNVINEINGTVYAIDSYSHNSIQNYLYQVFHNGTIYRYAEAIPASLFVTSDAVQAIYEPFNSNSITSDPADTADGQGTNQTGLDQILNNIATGMTNR